VETPNLPTDNLSASRAPTAARRESYVHDFSEVTNLKVGMMIGLEHLRLAFREVYRGKNHWMIQLLAVEYFNEQFALRRRIWQKKTTAKSL